MRIPPLRTQNISAGITANLRTKILDFGGLDSSRILSLRGGILMSIGNFPGNLQSTNLSSDYLSREIGRMPAT